MNHKLLLILLLLLAWPEVQGQEQDTTLTQPRNKLCPVDTVEIQCGKETFQIEISQYCRDCSENESMFPKFRILHKGKEIFQRINNDCWTFVDQDFHCLRYARKYGKQFGQPYFWLLPGDKNTCSLMWFGYPYSTGSHTVEIYRLDETGQVECLYNDEEGDRFIEDIRKEGESLVVAINNNPYNNGFLFESSPHIKFWELRIDKGLPQEKRLTPADRAERMKELERQCRKLLREPVRETKSIASQIPQGGWRKTEDPAKIRRIFLQNGERQLLKIGVRCGDSPLYPEKAADRWVVLVNDSIDFAKGDLSYRIYDPSGKNGKARFGTFLVEDEKSGLFTGISHDGKRYTATIMAIPSWYDPENRPGL